MLIPKTPIERENFYVDLVMKCMVSRNDRAAEYERLKNYFMFGTEDGQKCEFNKIDSHIDLLSSFLFASETTKFSLSLGVSVPKSEYKKVNSISQAVYDEWLRAGIDTSFSNCVMWACVYNSSFLKLFWKDGIHAYMVEPQQFGVLREDLPSTDRQEAVVHRYYVTLGDLRWRLNSHPDRESILSSISASKREQQAEPSGVQRLVISATTPNMIGSIEGLPSGTRYQPQVNEDLVEMTELWVWSDEDQDYLTVTIADPGVIIYDRKNIFLSGELPFVQICPNPLYNYYWGRSEVDKLTSLQDWRSRRMKEISELLARAVRPPKAMNGSFGILDEKNFALDRPAGLLTFTDPMAKIEEFKPQVPQDVFAEIREIDQMFNETSGLSSILQGGGERGVRTRGHVDKLAQLGSARPKKRALVVEDALEKAATLCLKMIQKYDPRILVDDEDQKFIAEQFTHDYVMKVDSHSSSPIFVEDQRDLAFALFDKEAIDKETLIEMSSPPSPHLLKQRLKAMEARAALAQASQPPEQES